MMIDRISAAALGGVATAAATTAPTPVVWHFFGYPFEVASMIAAVMAAIAVRVVINLRNRSTSVGLDLAVLGLVLVTTVAVVAGAQTNLTQGLLYGTGIGTIGEGLIRIAEKYTNKGLGILGVDVEPTAVLPPSAPPAHEAAALDRLTGELDKID